MRATRTIGAVICIAAAGLCVRLASAQSTDIIIVDNLPDDSPDATKSDTVSADAGSLDASADIGHRIQIDRLGYELPQIELQAEPENDRQAIERKLVEHVKYCVGNRTVDPSAADVRFLYLVRTGRPNATLTSVSGDEAMHLSKLHVDVLRSVGEERAIDVREAQKVFRECVEVVTLDEKPVVTERVSFRIRAGALTLTVHDVGWAPL